MNEKFDDPTGLLGYSQNEIRGLGQCLFLKLVPDNEFSAVIEHVQSCKRLAPGQYKNFEYHLLPKNSCKPLKVSSRDWYHCGDGDRCTKISGIATPAANTSHISRMSYFQEQREGEYSFSLLEQCLLSGKLEMKFDPEDNSVLRLFFSTPPPRGTFNLIYPLIDPSKPSVKVVEIWLPRQAKPVNTISRENCKALYEATREFCTMSTSEYRAVNELEVLSELFEAKRNGRSMSIVKHESNIGLYTTNNAGCGIKTVDWIGRNMLDGWEPHEHRRFCETIEKHGVVQDLEWHALQMTEEKARIWQRADVEMVYFQDTLCRIVRGKELKILG